MSGTGTTTELFQTPISWTAGYDSRNRLTSFTRTGAETRYTYDANSNRLTALESIAGSSDFDAVLTGDITQTTSQALNVEGTSNRLLGFTQTLTSSKNGKATSSVSTPVTYTVDANGAMTSDGLRTFVYDGSNRLSKVEILKDGEAASVVYLHNALGQRVFKSEPQAEQTLPNEDDLGQGFVNWLRKSFGWIFQKGAKASLGQAFVYGDGEIPSWALLGEYDNGSASSKGRAEYIWLPTEDGSAIPIGMYKGGQFYAIHTDHLGTPRVITDSTNTPVWQWPYSGFGNNKPTGPLASATSGGQTTLKGTKTAVEVNLRFPGQMEDSETGLVYNYFRTYDPRRGGYTQADPIGLDGGLSRFAYAHSNAIRYWDPKGLVPNPAEVACLLGPNPVCAGGVAADILTWIVAPTLVAGSVAMSTSDCSPTKETCSKAIKLLEQVERLAQKLGKKLPQRRIDDLRQKINDGTITSSDLPGDIQQEFPPELRGKTLDEIRKLCGKAR